jgi:hypothetical protein
VAEEYLRSFTANWHAPTAVFVRRATLKLKNFIHTTIDARCKHFLHGELPKHLWCGHISENVDLVKLTFPPSETIDGHLGECITRTNAAVALLLKLEGNVHTRNNRYYRECKEKFLNHLKMGRDLASDNPSPAGFEQAGFSQRRETKSRIHSIPQPGKESPQQNRSHRDRRPPIRQAVPSSGFGFCPRRHGQGKRRL